MLAAVVVRALRKAKMAMGKVAQRVYIERGVRKMETKQVHATQNSELALLIRCGKRSCKLRPGSRKVLLLPKHVV